MAEISEEAEVVAALEDPDSEAAGGASEEEEVSDPDGAVEAVDMVGPKKVEEAIRTGEEDPMVEVDLEGLVVDLPSKTDS